MPPRTASRSAPDTSAWGRADPLSERVFTRGVQLFLYALFRTLFSLEVRGLGNIPRRGPVILAANHQSYLDPPILGSVLISRHPHFLSKLENFSLPVLGRLIKSLGAYPIDRDQGHRGMRFFLERLREGAMMVMFPESTVPAPPGTRRASRTDFDPDTGLLPGKPGVVAMAQLVGCPIVPVGISGTGLAFPPERVPMKVLPPWPYPAPITIRIGKPFLLPERPEPHQDRAWLTHEVMKRISQLVDFDRGAIPFRLPLTPADYDRLKQPASSPGARKIRR